MGALRPGGEHGLQLRGICGQFVNSGLDRVDEFDDGLGGVFLQIAVAVSGIAVDENVDVGPVTADWMFNRLDTPGLTSGS